MQEAGYFKQVEKCCIGAFVTFNHIESARRCVADYSQPRSVLGQLNQLLDPSAQPAPLLFNTYKLKRTASAPVEDPTPTSAKGEKAKTERKQSKQSIVDDYAELPPRKIVAGRGVTKSDKDEDNQDQLQDKAEQGNYVLRVEPADRPT